MAAINLLKRALPGRDMKLPILFGPFRGGSFHSNPRSSLRKVFGLYEYEHAAWLRAVLLLIGRARGAWMRVTALALILLRTKETAEAQAALVDRLKQVKGLEVRVVEAGQADGETDGTKLFGALSS
eukprot:gene56718-77744_t